MKLVRVMGVLMLVGGIVLSFYIGFWVCFVGGVVQIINEIKSPHAIVIVNIAWGTGKIVFAALFVWLAELLLIIPGIAMATS